MSNLAIIMAGLTIFGQSCITLLLADKASAVGYKSSHMLDLALALAMDITPYNSFFKPHSITVLSHIHVIRN